MCVHRELVEYKYVVLNADGTVDRWQPGDNLKMEVPVAQVRGPCQLVTASTATTAARCLCHHCHKCHNRVRNTTLDSCLGL